MSERIRTVHWLPVAILLWMVALPADATVRADLRLLDEVLVRNVHHGVVDYDGIRDDPAFDRYLSQLARADQLPVEADAERLSFFLNAFNALAIRQVLDGVTMERPGPRRRFMRQSHQVMGRSMTLEEIRTELFESSRDPRMRIAAVCPAMACPRLASRAFMPDELDAQLDHAVRRFVNDGSRNRFDGDRRIAMLSWIWREHFEDYAGQAGSLEHWLAPYVDDPQVAASLREERWEIRWLEPEWDLNGIRLGQRR